MQTQDVLPFYHKYDIKRCFDVWRAHYYARLVEFVSDATVRTGSVIIKLCIMDLLDGHVSRERCRGLVVRALDFGAEGPGIEI